MPLEMFRIWINSESKQSIYAIVELLSSTIKHKLTDFSFELQQ